MGAVRRGLYWLAGAVALLLLAAAVLSWAGGRYQQEAELRDAVVFPPPGQMLAVDGRAMHIDCQGYGDLPVIFEAGLGNWSIHWSAVRRLLGKDFLTCAYDRAGYGWSEPGFPPRSGPRMVAELHGLLSAKGLKPPYILVGHSLGGLLVRIYSRQYPGEVAGMVLVDPAHENMLEALGEGYRRFMEGSLENFKGLHYLSRWGLPRLLYQEVIPTFGLPTDLAGVNAAYMTHRSYYAAWVEEASAFHETAATARDSGSLGDIPLVVVSAGRSFRDMGIETPAMNQAWGMLHRDLARLSGDGQLVEAAGVGHLVMTDDPAVVRQAVETVVNRHRARVARLSQPPAEVPASPAEPAPKKTGQE